MKTTSKNIQLNRSDRTFQAGIAIVLGKLDALLSNTNLLHPKEKTTLEGYQYDLRKTSYLLGRLSAKAALKQMAEQVNSESIWIDSGIFQFPIVKCPTIQNVQVSISHCDNIGLSIAFPEAHPIGLDIEKINAEQVETLLTQITAKEVNLLKENDLENIHGFTAIWSMKEAVSKILKTGMMMDFKLLEIKSLEVKDRILKSTFTNLGQYQAYAYLPNEIYAVAIALPGRTETDLKPVWEMLDTIID